MYTLQTFLIKIDQTNVCNVYITDGMYPSEGYIPSSCVYVWMKDFTGGCIIINIIVNNWTWTFEAAKAIFDINKNVNNQVLH